MPLYRDEGVVLRTVKLGESDRIITLLTRGHGKVRAVAKGVRRTTSRFGARLEPFMRVDLLIATGRSLDVVSQAESLAPYAAAICTDYQAYGAASLIAETVDKLVTAEGERATGQYRLLIAALAALARHAHDPRAIGASYVMRALSLAGWEPRLDACVVCGRPTGLHGEVGAMLAGEAGRVPAGVPGAVPAGARIHFSTAAGGVMCAADRTPEAVPVAPPTLAQLAALVTGDWSVLDAAPLADDTERLVEAWAEQTLERPLRSFHTLDG